MNFYDSIIEGAQELPANERGQLYAAALEYLYYGREPDFKMKPAPKALFVAMRPVFDNQRSQSARAKKPRPSRRKTDGQPNASPKLAETQPDDSQDLAESQPNASEQEQEQELEKEPLRGSKKTRPRFVPPTEEEVDAYLKERGLAAYLTGAQFVGYYGSQDWRKANGQKVTNWELAASGWADRERKRGPRKGGDDGFDDFAL